jgi:hypothetical protein
MEKEEWKPFRNVLDKSEKKKFDVLFGCLNSSFQLIPILLVYGTSQFPRPYGFTITSS